MSGLDLSSAFGVVLKKHREANHLSQEALAERADIHPTHVSLIERFQRNASLDVADALATGVGMHLSELIREAEELRGARDRTKRKLTG